MSESLIVSRRVMAEVLAERERQDAKFPSQTLPDLWRDGTSVGLAPPQVALAEAQGREHRAKEEVRYRVEHNELTWADVLEEEVAEAGAATSLDHLREELVQVAAVAVRWVEDIDRRAASE